MERIIIDETVRTASQPNVLNPDIHDGYYFNEFIESRKSKEGGISDADAFELREKTFDILSHCNPHDATTAQDTTHLVIGYVQSGKTMSFTALTTLARDNNYKIIIYLAGTKNNLLEQTKNRLEKDLFGKNRANKDSYRIINLRSKQNDEIVSQIIGGLRSAKRLTLLVPILKHNKYINSLTSILKNPEVKEALGNETVIIIDDEADQASLNSYSRRNAQRGEERKSSIYDAILKLRAQLPGNSYVQYTATPQANLLIDMEDFLSPKSHTLLTPGEGYIGGKLFFGCAKNGELFHGRLIMTIPPSDVYDKKNNQLESIPQSLRYALMLHILAVAIVVEWKKTPKVEFLSMMVHSDNTKKVNSKFKGWIDGELSRWRRLIERPDGYDDKLTLYSNFNKVFEEAVKFYAEYERPCFEDIRPLIKEVLYNCNTYLVTSENDYPEIGWNSYCSHILVGAEMLNRGFTVENLSTTYMSRHSSGKDNADTIEQRCRFFGYKKAYIKSCRVFLPEESSIKYREYVNHEEEMRTVLAESSNLRAAEQTMMLTKDLRPTRLNVIPPQVVNEELKGMCGMYAFDSKYIIDNNNRVVEQFLKKYENMEGEEIKYNTTDRTHLKIKIPSEDIIELLTQFRFGNSKDAIRKANTIRYLRYLSSAESARRLEYVYFIQMAYKGEIRHRSYDQEGSKLQEGTDIFAGPSKEGTIPFYPGDRKIIGGEDTLTFQLHHIYLDKASIDFPHRTYTLAIYYPDSLATVYCVNTQNIKDLY